MDILEVQDISKTYGEGEAAVHALKGVSFCVPKGEFVAVVGASGSGKSTLLNMIGALDNPTAGKVLIDGRDIFRMKDEELTIFRRRCIGFIFQAYNLIPELNVEQNITFPLLLDYQKPDPDYLEELFYLQFKEGVNIRQAISEIKETYGLSDEQLQANVMLLGLMGQSDDTTLLEVYLTAVILFVLVAMAGIFMIASSFNMSILERTQFFGLLRCLGATKKQMKRYIRLEGLLYCVKAIPIGLIFGCILLWCAVFVLNALNSQYLPEIQRFQISYPGIAADKPGSVQRTDDSNLLEHVYCRCPFGKLLQAQWELGYSGG